MPTTSGLEEEDPARVARAYNDSIYLMVGMPYFLLGAVGFLIYWNVYRAAKRPAQEEPPLPPGEEPAPDGQGDLPCPPPSPGAASSGIRLPPGR